MMITDMVLKSASMTKKEMALDISLMIRTEMTLNSSQMARTEMVLKTVVYSPYNHLVRLLDREYFNVYKTYSLHDVRGLVMGSTTNGD
jgi:hypothetical protein